jgi:hypothetical protein
MGKSKLKWRKLDLEQIQFRPGEARLEFACVEVEKEEEGGEEEGGDDENCSFFKKKERKYERRKVAMRKMRQRFLKNKMKNMKKKDARQHEESTIQKKREAKVKVENKCNKENADERAPWRKLHEAVWEKRIERSGRKRELRMRVMQIYSCRLKEWRASS